MAALPRLLTLFPRLGRPCIGSAWVVRRQFGVNLCQMTRYLTLLCTLIGTPVLAASPHQCLAEAIYFEAGSRGDMARFAVGHTILNRKNSPKFPDTICEVIHEGEADGDCQFSYRCDGLPETYQYPGQLRRAELAARKLLAGEIKDPTNGALFFHSDQIEPGWFATRTRTGSFGGNIFYK